MSALDDSEDDPSLTDEEGIAEAYAAPDAVVQFGDTLYIAGTRSIKDGFDDMYIPLGETRKTQRYRQAREALGKGKGKIKHLAGHSLGGAVVAKLLEDYPELDGRAYGAPLVRSRGNDRLRTFRHFGDVISVFDFGAKANRAPGLNPHSYRGY